MSPQSVQLSALRCDSVMIVAVQLQPARKALLMCTLRCRRPTSEWTWGVRVIAAKIAEYVAVHRNMHRSN